MFYQLFFFKFIQLFFFKITPFNLRNSLQTYKSNTIYHFLLFYWPYRLSSWLSINSINIVEVSIFTASDNLRGAVSAHCVSFVQRADFCIGKRRCAIFFDSRSRSNSPRDARNLVQFQFFSQNGRRRKEAKSQIRTKKVVSLTKSNFFRGSLAFSPYFLRLLYCSLHFCELLAISQVGRK